ncbi:MAG: T9SS type A sorting domain-containing protein, partial [Rhodothermales bacterium]|nr:T9SS type A sorting domain-containing protein [Rhodothermales bacterium]
YTYTRSAGDISFISVDWDGNNDAVTFVETGLGGVDLTAGGANAFQFNITANRSSNFEIKILVHTDASNSSLVNPVATTGTGVQTICYSSFSVASGTGADFANVGAVQFDTGVGFVAAQDWDIGQLQYVNSGSCGLPVELTSFDAVVNGNDVLLSWQTSSERSALGFGVERRSVSSDDANDWSEAAFVLAAGESSELRDYTLSIEALPAGEYAFRLRFVDVDGSFEYSETIEVDIEHPDNFVLGSAYPNPFNPSTSFVLSVKQTQNVEIGLFDLLGRQVVDVYSGPVEAGAARTFRIDASGLTTGVYMIRASGQFDTRSSAVLLVK